MDSESVGRSSAPCTVSEGELIMDLGLLDFKRESVDGDLIDWDTDLAPFLPSAADSSVSPVPTSSPERAPVPEFRPESPEAHKCLPPTRSCLLLRCRLVCPSARPQPTISTVGAPRDCHPPASLWREYPLTPPPASKLRTPPRSDEPSAAPWLLAPSSPPWPGSPLAPPGSLRLRLGLASIIRCLGTPLLRLRLVPSSLRLRQAPSSPQLLLSPLSLRLHRGLSDPRLCGGALGSFATVGRPPGVVSPSSSMAPPSVGSTVGRRHGCGLGPTWHRMLQVPPGSSLLRHLPGLCLPAPSRVFVLLLSLLPCSYPSLPMLCLRRKDAPSRRAGDMSRPWTVCVVFAPHVLPVTQFLPCVIEFIDSRCVLSLPPRLGVCIKSCLIVRQVVLRVCSCPV